MKNVAILIALVSILFVNVAASQPIDPMGVSNALKGAGIDPASITEVEQFTYGPFVAGAAGEEYLPDAELDRWYRDIWESGENHILIMGGTYDALPFRNQKMNAVLNDVTGNSRGRIGYRFALPKERMGQIHLVLMMEPIESEKRMAIMYRATLKKATPAPVATSPVDDLKAKVDSLARRVNELQAAQPKQEEAFAPHDGIYILVGGGSTANGTGQRGNAKSGGDHMGLGGAISLSFHGDWELGYIGAGAYLGQGGHGFFIEKRVMSAESDRLTTLDFHVGSSLTMFRKLDQTESPRSLRIGQMYVGFKSDVRIFSKRHPLHFVVGIGTSFEVLTTKNGGLRFLDYQLGGMMRVQYAL